MTMSPGFARIKSSVFFYILFVKRANLNALYSVRFGTSQACVLRGLTRMATADYLPIQMLLGGLHPGSQWNKKEALLLTVYGTTGISAQGK